MNNCRPAIITEEDFNALPDGEKSRRLEELLKSAGGRRWVRTNLTIDRDLAGKLIEFHEDFATPRRDPSLANVILALSPSTLARRATAIAAGPAGGVMWAKLTDDLHNLERVASHVIADGSSEAARATMALLVLDPLDQYELGEDLRTNLAVRALDASDPETRSQAAEYLATAQPSALANRIARLALDVNPGVRLHGWNAAFAINSQEARELALDLLGEEAEELAVRRSALQAVATNQPTNEVEDILSFFVMHPDHSLAMDAATLFHSLHRSPVIAEAAMRSPHEDVREIAQRLMDPYRGSPAAGGSRPGDPTGSDAYARMLRMLESEKTEE